MTPSLPPPKMFHWISPKVLQNFPSMPHQQPSSDISRFWRKTQIWELQKLFIYHQWWSERVFERSTATSSDTSSNCLPLWLHRQEMLRCFSSSRETRLTHPMASIVAAGVNIESSVARGTLCICAFRWRSLLRLWDSLSVTLLGNPSETWISCHQPHLVAQYQVIWVAVWAAGDRPINLNAHHAVSLAFLFSAFSRHFLRWPLLAAR